MQWGRGSVCDSSFVDCYRARGAPRAKLSSKATHARKKFKHHWENRRLAAAKHVRSTDGRQVEGTMRERLDKLGLKGLETLNYKTN